MAKFDETIIHLHRQRSLPNNGSQTLWCDVTTDGGMFKVMARLRPGQFPEFEGENAWFAVRRYPKSRFAFVAQVAGKDAKWPGANV